MSALPHHHEGTRVCTELVCSTSRRLKPASRPRRQGCARTCSASVSPLLPKAPTFARYLENRLAQSSKPMNACCALRSTSLRPSLRLAKNLLNMMQGPLNTSIQCRIRNHTRRVTALHILTDVITHLLPNSRRVTGLKDSLQDKRAGVVVRFKPQDAFFQVHSSLRAGLDNRTVTEAGGANNPASGGVA